ncbi:ParB N-terminal domain-containing protein [Lacrimispora sp.]|uniref:ParB N-terminal domain-containing protein n=1 Tax=Lacrimispora sp. TaxID=2719234 RepID=UPI00345F7447
MAIPKPKVSLIDFDEMLGIEPQQDATPAPVQGGILDMDFSLMESFPNHRFKLYEGQQLDDMVDSIRQFGILLPIILWYTEDGRYIILSGHNRKNAAQLAGFTKGPVIIRENLTYEDAVLIVTETNLRQRSFGDMSYSERAYCLAQHYAALKSQGKRNDLLAEIEMLLNPHDTEENSTSSEVQTKLRSDEKLGQNYGLSRDKVAKYIRISNLIEPLISRVDSGEIAFLAAYDLSVSI